MNRMMAFNPPTAVTRILKFSLFRGASLLVTVAISLFLAVMIANLGGYLDTILKAEVTESVNGMLMSGWLKNEPEDVRDREISQMVWNMEEARGLHQPFLGRVLEWWRRGMTMDWGRSLRPYTLYQVFMGNEVATFDIRTLIFTYLPRTLLFLGTANLLLFLFSTLIALYLVRRAHPRLDRLLIFLSPLSSVPAWMYGAFTYAFFYQTLKVYWLKIGYSDWPLNFGWRDLGNLAAFLALPVLSILFSKIFQGILIWKTYLNIFANENYMELAKAKGLPTAVLERRHLLRPALPGFITSFALIAISIWQECITVEMFFHVGGIGSFFLAAINNSDTNITVAIISLFAYILAITVFLLDITYALVDPRVKLDVDKVSNRPARISLRRNGKGIFFETNLALRLDFSFKGFGESLRQAWLDWRSFFSELSKHRSAVAGLVVILILAVISLLTVILIPYDQAISIWRGDNKVWFNNPVQAPPAWTNYFRDKPLPVNIIVSSQAHPDYITSVEELKESKRMTIILPFRYEYTEYPQDMVVSFSPRYKEKQPFVSMTWITPEGREIRTKGMAAGFDTVFYFDRSSELKTKLKTKSPLQAMFTPVDAKPGETLKGNYQLRIDAILFEKDSSLDAQLTVYGKVFGIAGTDNDRRDLTLVLLWGTAVALSFGILASFGTVFSSMILAAISAWHGGWIDGLIQRFTEINMILPVLPTSIMIFILYSKSFWVIVGVTIALGIFSSSIKNYRAVFLQVKELPYIEAAQAYGSSNNRIIFQYLIPKIRAMLIPQFIILVPAYVFYEATLAFLGVSDPWLPTLGKLFVAYMKFGVFNDPPYLYVQPLLILLLIGLSFALFGFALERIFSEQAG